MSTMMDLDDHDEIVDWNDRTLHLSEAESSEDGSDIDGSDESGEEDSEEDDSENEGKNDEEGEGEGEDDEGEIESDFDRLVKNIRQRDPTSSTLGAGGFAGTSGAGGSSGTSGAGGGLPGVLTKEWDLTIAEQEAQFKDDLREASGIGRKRKKKGRPPGPTLSPHVKSLLGLGNQAYVDGDLEGAIRIMHEVIRIEPRAAAAWSVLAGCYLDMGEGRRALQLRIMGAHLGYDPEEWEGLGRESRELGYNQQALYCYRKVYSLDPTNVDALWDRASLAREMGDWRTAKTAYLAILKRVPHDLTVLRELHAVLVELSEYALCAGLLRDAMEYYMGQYPMGGAASAAAGSAAGSGVASGSNAGSTSQQTQRQTQQQHQQNQQPQQQKQQNHQHPQPPFTPLHLLLLADLYNVLGEYDNAIDTIKRGTRWWQGRAGERWWGGVGDDREYDVWGVRGGGSGSGRSNMNNTSNNGVGGVGGGSATPSHLGRGAAGVAEGGTLREGGGDEGDVKPGYHPLDCNARHRLAVARIKMGDVEEGKLHASLILSEDVLDYSVLFLEIADAYFDKEMYADAKVIYELLGGDEATSSVYVLLQTAACMKNVGELRDAADVYEHVCLADPTNNDAKMKLAEIYEILGETRKALKLVYEVIDSRKKRKAPAGGATTSDQPPTPSSHVDQGDASATPTGTTPTAGIGPTPTSLFPEDKSGAKGKTGAGAAGAAQGRHRLTAGQLRALEEEKEREVVRGWRRCCEIWEGVGGGGDDKDDKDEDGDGGKDDDEDDKKEREWMVEAEKLVDMFRETRNLFLTSRSNPFAGMFPRSRMRRRVETEADEDRMADRLQLDIEQDALARRTTKTAEKVGGVTVFRGVSFDDWLRLIMQYCFILTKRGQYDVAEEILRHIMVSNAYQPQDRQNSIRIALITCSILAERPDIVVEQARKLITTHQFNNEPLRILLASLASGLKLTDSFITSTLQKHLFREMKLSDVAVKNPGVLRWNALNRRYAATAGTGATGRKVKGEEGDEDDEDEDMPAPTPGPSTGATTGVDGAPKIPTKENPVIVAIYGQICVAAKSYQSAIFYLLHAYDYYPNDPMICLCLAIASIGRAMQRQSDNRHHLVVQAMAFLTKYRKLRGTTTPGVREVEYNFGRTFHQLGLYSHAVKHYERVLELAEQAGDDLFAREAAFNLSCIFVFTGAVPLADTLYKKWLSL